MVDSLIQQGAEALILRNKDKIIKDRIKKSYRISELDNKITSRRTKAEAKLLTKASEIISCPKPLSDPGAGRMIHMPFIDGKKLSEYLDNFSLKKQKEVCRKIGESVAKLHNANIIHGDLTTSNMILKNNKIYFVDFGLGFISHKIEDKAVDLHLLREALEARHFKHWKNLFKEVISKYKNYGDFKKVLERLKAVEKRGRYKDKY